MRKDLQIQDVKTWVIRATNKWYKRNILKIKCITIKRNWNSTEHISAAQLANIFERSFHIVQIIQWSLNKDDYFYLSSKQTSIGDSIPCKSCDRKLQEDEVLHLDETTPPVSKETWKGELSLLWATIKWEREKESGRGREREVRFMQEWYTMTKTRR